MQPRKPIPWMAVGLLAVGTLAFLAAALYTVRRNPEIRFFREAASLKTAWARQMTQPGTTKVVVFGGSSCAFSIDAERLWRAHGLRAVNLGLGAGMGATVLTRFAMDQARSGDTLVVAVEPGLLNDAPAPPMLGVQFALAMGHPEWLDGPGPHGRYPRVSAWLTLRPGAYHCLTWLGKVLSGKADYRYQVSEFNPSGWQQSPLRWPITPIPIPSPTLHPDSVALLDWLREWGNSNQVRVVYSLPWGFAADAGAAETRRGNAAFLATLAEHLPVLKDEHLGVYTNRAHFADTPWHLTAEAAHARTEELSSQLKEWRLWTLDELDQRSGQAAAR